MADAYVSQTIIETLRSGDPDLDARLSQSFIEIMRSGDTNLDVNLSNVCIEVLSKVSSGVKPLLTVII